MCEDPLLLFEQTGLDREFEPRAWIGEGSSALVFRAVHSVTGLVVALKVWDRLSPQERGRFLREVDIMRRATTGRREEDTCLVRLHWAGETIGPVRPVAWVAMELYECSLAERLESPRPLTGDEAAQVCRDLLTGLATLHASGILHRDVKPANVLLRDRRAALSDFGLAARSLDDVSCRQAGTPAFMAPELEGQHADAPTVRSDIFAAGKTVKVVADHLAETSHVTMPGIAGVVARATAEHPHDRFDTVEQMRVALEDAVAGISTPAGRLRAFLHQRGLTPTVLRRRVTAPLLAALLAAVGLGAALTWPMPAEARIASILSPPHGATVRDKECFSGEVLLKEGEGLLLGQRNLDAVDAQWGFVRVSQEPPAGSRGIWRVTQFFGVDAGIGQRHEVQLALIPAAEAPRGSTPQEKLEAFKTSTRLATMSYRRAQGVGVECDE